MTVSKINEVNYSASGMLEGAQINKALDKVAAAASKQVKVDGFRAGKVPVAVVKKMYKDKLSQDAEGEVLREFLEAATKELKIDASKMIGQPTFKKYEKKENGDIEIEIELSLRPEPKIEGYAEVVPSFEKPKADEKEVQKRLEDMAKQGAEYVKIKRKRMVRDGDMVVIDFEGFVDGKAFDGGKAEKYNLKIGSGSFIPGFEDQIIGMKYEEEKEITVTFPAEYASKDLAGKEAMFKVKLHEIQEQAEVEIDDALAKKLLNDEKATLDTLKEKIADQVVVGEISKLYNDELKPKLIEALVEKYDFDLPNNIVEQEIDNKVNQKAREMTQEEIKEIQADTSKLEALREEMREEAQKSVKATFIVDVLAKEEKIEVNDQEVSQAIYYEALMGGQDPQKVMEYYTQNNLLAAVKMGMIEDKLFGKLLGLDEK